VGLSVFTLEDFEEYLWVLQCENILCVRFLDKAKFTIVNLTSLLISCKHSFQIVYLKMSSSLRPPLWSSGQSSWLQIRRPGFDSRH
jgi:hypothetical protein